MLTVKEIKELISTVNDSNLAEFTYEQEDMKLHLKKTTNETTIQVPTIPVEQVRNVSQEQVQAKPEVQVNDNQPKVEAKEENTQLHTIESPMVGTFYTSPSPDASQYVEIGQQVSENSVVCIVEAMKLMNEIEAEVNGKIVEILAENGELVEYGQPLFVVERR
ncbi:acetyl-CoA carboxylase biotin carboxyl carrier protein [Alkalihalobacillus trypoxylicola]|uniref:Biotin carboxyl carrier protein of acetyl-CoA carboxylase n=1 Tax=Alkalihalobacillus trypoxylicola TaxID=519424 RepID=A0A162DVD5_9BACI|nr:acetyl-CoA carboxylase biotin carboxyl carrier protein [Alkalihalobacillus trypoxylicola]KYG30955.1 acetyl-CoA carboxylase biotin carboxyl carrier protein subunit [Alkalihalobacillus trypoxylicola]